MSTAVPTDRFLAAIVESSDDAIIGKTLEGTITSWNRGAEIVYGYLAEEALGQPISLIIPPERPNELPAIMEQLRRGERIDHYETIRVRKDGTRFDMSVSISPIRDDAGRVVGAFLEGGADYASNTLDRTWPRGLDTEVLARAALDAVDATATEPYEREHVTPAIWQHPERFRLRSVRNAEDLSRVRLTVDTPEDLALVEAVFEAIGRDDVELDEVLDLLAQRPELAAINAAVAKTELGA